MKATQRVIDECTGIAVRRLGVTCPPDLLLGLALQTAELCGDKTPEEDIPIIFGDVITEYLLREGKEVLEWKLQRRF